MDDAPSRGEVLRRLARDLTGRADVVLDMTDPSRPVRQC
jgi:hypothetical protein